MVLAAVTVSVAAYYRGAGDSQGPAFVTSPVSRGDVVATIDATGALETVETVEVGTQVSGTITSLHADFNSAVRAGQIVARLEPSLFETQVDQARASLMRAEADRERARVGVEEARLTLARAQELWKQQLIPRMDLEAADATARQAEASLKSADAQVAQARATLNQNQVNLSHTIIQAPIDGVVISRNVDVGQTVAASMSAPTLFVIARDLSRMQVNASIDESDIGRVEPGQRVTFTVDAYPVRTYAGTVSEVRLQPVVESSVVSYVTIIDVPNADLTLKPGMTANVTIEVAREEDVLRVPSSALRFQPSSASETRTARGDDGRGARVWVIQEGRLTPVAVTPGISDGAATVIAEGDLHEGSTVVTGMMTQATVPAASGSSPLIGGRRTLAGGRR